MSDLARLARKISRCLGVEVVLTTDYEAKTPLIVATVDDREQSGNTFRVALGPPSKREDNLRRTHELVYHSRAKEKHRQQGGKCAHCGKALGNLGECDHINPRGRFGRDDQMPNLQIVCPPFSGGCDFHQLKHGQGQRRTA